MRDTELQSLQDWRSPHPSPNSTRPDWPSSRPCSHPKEGSMRESALLKLNSAQSPVLRFFGWLLSWRILRRLTFGVLCLAALTVVFYSEENWRGARAELDYRRTLEAKGRILDYTRFVPPSVADDQNFASTGFFAPLFDFNPGTQTARDTNAWKRTVDFAKDFPATALKDGWQMGRRIDLAAC